MSDEPALEEDNEDSLNDEDELELLEDEERDERELLEPLEDELDLLDELDELDMRPPLRNESANRGQAAFSEPAGMTLGVCWRTSRTQPIDRKPY